MTIVGLVGGAVAVLNWWPEDPPPPEATSRAAASRCATPTSVADPPVSRRLSPPRRPRLRPGVDYSGVIRTSCGDIAFDLLEQRERETANFLHLVDKGFFNGLSWSEVIPNSHVMTGDPNDTIGFPPEDAGYRIRVQARETTYRYGDMALVVRGGFAGSQFFVSVHDYAGAAQGAGSALDLGRAYPVFARVYPASFPALEKIARQPLVGGTDPRLAAKPLARILIHDVEVVARRK